VTPAAIVFDLDGTLVDTMEWVPGTYVDTIRALGGPVVTAEEVLASFSFGPTAAVLERFLRRPIAARDLECYHDHYTIAAAATRPFAGVVPMLDALRADGVPLGVFTGALKRAATHLLATAGLSAWFAAVVGGDEAGNAKPAPDGLLLACRRLGVDPEDTAYVGDAATDLECAVSAGSLAVHAGWSGTVLPVAAAHAVAPTPGEVSAVVTAHLGAAAAARRGPRNPPGTRP
jgi:HAD superfamily hydrolase (TIGR01549 family)